MSRDEIFNKLKEVIQLANTSDPDALKNCKEESNLRNDLGLTSIGVLYVAIALEEAFNIEFSGVSFDQFETVKDVIDYIEKRV